MNNKITHDELSLSALEHIDEECLRFESAWKSNQPPDLNEFVGDAMGAERAELIRQLVLLDFDYRQKSGQRPTFDNYREQLPDDVGAINLAFRKIETDGFGILMTRSIATDQTDETTTGSLRVKCPDCHSAIELACDADLEEISCPGCGSKFNLLGNEDGRSSDARKTAGRFQLLEKLGEGGFGAVWRAQDPELDRIVAIKIPRKNQVSVQEAGQFLREARAAAQLHHPNIVSVHEVGREDDTIYIVSDFVEGETLAERIAQQPLSMREAAELCVKIADALEHAHQQGVVHRDLKPGNIMLDAAGEPHVMDFGLAKREAGEVTMTLDGNILGTPAYMSPEQAKGMSHRADRRTDIYSLGVILFEMFTGERPFRGNAQMLIKQVLEDEPPLPRSLNGNVPRDLETICLKCLEKNPDRRFASASELGGELRLFLNGQPITSRPVSQTERFVRWSKRKPALAALGALILCVAIAAPIVAVYQSRLRFNETQAKEELRKSLYTSDMNSATQAWLDGNVPLMVEVLSEHEPKPDSDEDDLRRFEWYYLWNLAQKSQSVPTLNHGTSVNEVAVSNDGKWIVTAGSGGTIKIWNASTQGLHKTVATGQATVYAIRYSPNGEKVASAGRDGTVIIWNARTWEREHVLHGHDGKAYSLAFSPKDGLLISGGWDGGVVTWDIETGKIVRRLEHGAAVSGVAISSNQLVASCSFEDKMIRLWNHAGDKVADIPYVSCVYCVTFSPDGRKLAWGAERNIVVWDVDRQEQITTITPHSGEIRSVAFSPDGKDLVSSGDDYVVRLHDLQTFLPIRQFVGHVGLVNSVCFARGGKDVVSASWDGTARIWDLEAHPDVLAGHTPDVCGAVLSPDPDNETIISYGEINGSIKQWDVSTGRQLSTLAEIGPRIYQGTLSKNGRILATACRDQTVKLWNVDRGELVNTLSVQLDGQKEGFMRSVAFSPNGRYLASGLSDGTIIVWDYEAGRRHAQLVHNAGYLNLAFSPDGHTLASAVGGSLMIWDLASKQPHFDLDFGQDRCMAVTYSHDGKIIAATSFGNFIQLWDTRTGHELSRITTNEYPVSLAFFPDDKTLAIGESGGEIKLWDMELQKVRWRLKAPSIVISIAISSDGETMVCGLGNGLIQILRADRN